MVALDVSAIAAIVGNILTILLLGGGGLFWLGKLGSRVSNLEDSMRDLRQELRDTRQEFHQELGGVRQEFHQELEGFRQEFHQELRGFWQEFRQELRDTRQELLEAIDRSHRHLLIALANHTHDAQGQAQFSGAVAVETPSPS